MADPTLLNIKITEAVSFRLIQVEGGSFNMGSDDRESEQPIHPVTLSSFYLAEYPVSQALWLAVVGGENPSNFPGPHRPVESISWYDAAAFCNQLSLHCGYASVYFSDSAFQKSLSLEATQKIEYPNTIPVFFNPQAKGFRLPTEAEWEYAARGGNKSGGFRYAGGDKLDEVGWYDDNSHGETKAVGIKLANELGLYDMSGNVWEWCADQWDATYRGAPKDGSAWLGLKEDVGRVLRGGSWYFNPQDCRPSYRSYDPPSSRNNDVGFRVVLGSPPGS
ncbi:MAG: formylglycine-generating enzyme family protein [Haliscomenobacter sp.]|uniref:formylglycine-generating enzyme family protein n=1 Tax=Haliscomenobacter sp. TaxID=2717303 RepID=UPI0029B9ABC4|nr:formylglycine-generating enzyme family protein [Haliscomenobacter sp.]MDX2072580.1 formylglycine-generating enzyme family protein [Haliscomenobacter sp.]